MEIIDEPRRVAACQRPGCPGEERWRTLFSAASAVPAKPPYTPGRAGPAERLSGSSQSLRPACPRPWAGCPSAGRPCRARCRGRCATGNPQRFLQRRNPFVLAPLPDAGVTQLVIGHGIRRIYGEFALRVSATASSKWPRNSARCSEQETACGSFGSISMARPNSASAMTSNSQPEIHRLAPRRAAPPPNARPGRRCMRTRRAPCQAGAPVS